MNEKKQTTEKPKQLVGIELSVENADKILGYLGNQPFKEVAGLIQLIQSSKPIYKEVETGLAVVK